MPKKVIIVPLNPKYLKNNAHPKPADAKITKINPLIISKKRIF